MYLIDFCKSNMKTANKDYAGVKLNINYPSLEEVNNERCEAYEDYFGVLAPYSTNKE